MVSLHVVWGTDECQTMKLLGRIKRQSAVILVDSGSTHNFIDQMIVKRLRCPTQSIKGMSVTVANEDKLRTQEVCKLLSWETHGLTQRTDFLVLPLKGCDLVLGVKWLKILGPITWDFSSLTM